MQTHTISYPPSKTRLYRLCLFWQRKRTHRTSSTTLETTTTNIYANDAPLCILYAVQFTRIHINFRWVILTWEYMSSYGIWNGFMWGQTIYRCYLSLIGNNSGQHQSAVQIGAKQNCLVVSVCWNRGSTIACLTHIVWWCGAHLGNFAFFSMHISVNAFDYPVHPTLLRQANTTSRVRCQNSVYAFHMLLDHIFVERTNEQTNLHLIGVAFRLWICALLFTFRETNQDVLL